MGRTDLPQIWQHQYSFARHEYQLNFFGNNGVGNGEPYCPFSSTGMSRRQMKNEALRLVTFQGWPLDFLSPRELAAAGFFYCRRADQTRCAFCLITIILWEPEDIPAAEHRRHAPYCPFIHGCNVENVPITMENQQQEEDPTRPPLLSARSLPGMYGGDIYPRFPNSNRLQARPDTEMASTFSIRPTLAHVEVGPSSSVWPSTPAGNLPTLGILAHQLARRPDLISLEARMNTFVDWPTSMETRPAKLAEAGFYYTKTGDHVKCFCCDGGFRDWEPKDDPWIEHARWFSRCNYLISMKGQDYVREVKARFQQSSSLVASSSTSNSQEDIQIIEKFKSPEAPSQHPKYVSEEMTKSHLRDALLCQLCCDQQLSMVFLPCGHSMCCPSCATALTTCPLCRKRIEAAVRAYFPFSS